MLEGSILQQLKQAHQPGNAQGKRPLNFGVYYKNTLVALCHALEDTILAHEYEPLMITAFQQGKWYLQEADRYGEIAGRSQQVVILAAPDAGFAEHPTSQRPNVALVSLADTDPVAQEWHLIIVSPHYTAMVLCQELSADDYQAAGLPQHDLERKFYGLWTFEPTLVQETVDLAIAHIALYNPSLSAQLSQRHAAIASQMHPQTALCGLPTVDHLGDTVARVVEYLHQDEGAKPQVSQPLLDENLVSNELQAFLRIAQLIDQTDLSNPMAAAEVSALAESIGQLLDLPAWQLHRLRLAGLLHRIASLQPAVEVLQPSGKRYGDDAPAQGLSCPLIPGVQMLRTMPQLKAIATILTHQTEWWNGTGQPAGLAGDEIPLESRLIGLVSCFQHRLAEQRAAHQEPPDQTSVATYAAALASCQAEQSDRWDPKLVEILALLVGGLQQGLSLPVAVPKIAAGLWLLDSHTTDDLLAFLNHSETVAVSPSSHSASITQEAYGS